MRVSAVACIEEETMFSEEGAVLRHYHVLHNPFAAKGLPSAVFGDRRQLVVSEAGEMSWVGQLGG